MKPFLLLSSIGCRACYPAPQGFCWTRSELFNKDFDRMDGNYVKRKTNERVYHDACGVEADVSIVIVLGPGDILRL